MRDIRQKVRSFVVENFLYGNEAGVNDDTSLLDEGVVDSTGIIEMVSYLEAEFNMVVEEEELTAENLSSIANVVAYVERKLSFTQPARLQGRQG